MNGLTVFRIILAFGIGIGAHAIWKDTADNASAPVQAWEQSTGHTAQN